MTTIGWTLHKASASLRKASTKDVLLITLLGMVEGEMLTYLEAHGATALSNLARTLEWPTPLIVMAAGALIRQGLAQGVKSQRGTLLAPQAAGHAA